MPRVRVEWVPLQTWNLGLFGFDHLLLTYEPAPNVDQLHWFAIEGAQANISGTPGTVLDVFGANGMRTLGHLNLVDDEDGIRLPTEQELLDTIGTPQSRGSRVTPLQNAEAAWATISNYATQIHQEAFPYTAISLPASANVSLNSTSLIASLLHYAGASLEGSLPFAMRYSPGRHTLLGTPSDDEMRIEAGFTNLFGGKGEDTFHGTNDTAQTERFYGGAGNDTFNWSAGHNIYHGGQRNLQYEADGLDTIVYDNVGVVTVRLPSNPHIPHFNARYVVDRGGTEDWLLSIERLEWRAGNDFIRTGPGVELIQQGIDFLLGAENSATPGDEKGDVFDFSGIQNGSLLINAAGTDALFVQADEADEKGFWIEDVEWVIGSGGDDQIYLNANMRGAEGGLGDDLVDARLAAGGSGPTSDGNTARIEGGAGDDTLVSSGGSTFAIGGAGADTFILSTMTGMPGSIGTVEFIIDEADPADRLFVPYNFFNQSQQGYDGSTLLPVLGALGSYADMRDNGYVHRFEWRLEDQIFYGTDETQGVLNFAGSIEFAVDSDDLVVSLYQGDTFDVPVINNDTGQIEYFETRINILDDTETIIRVKDYQPGDLGIEFHDYGAPTTITLSTGTAAVSYANFDNAVNLITNSGNLTNGLDPRPNAPSSSPNHTDQENAPEPQISDGTPGDDIITVANAQAHQVNAGEGNDTVNGNDGNDILDGGAGDDVLSGGGGNDRYVVDSTSDVVIEAAGQGTDTAISSVDFTLSAHVENLTLTDDAISGTGNALSNILLGNDADNTLDGGNGDDSLLGGAGNDTLIGGDGSDTYFYTAGQGDDVISDTGPGSETDTLYLSGYSAADVTLLRHQSNADDLHLLLAGGSRITVEDYFTAPGVGIDAISFDFDATLTRSDIDTLAATAAANAAPQAVNDTGLGLRGHDTVIPSLALLENDSDFDGDQLVITGVSSPSLGTATLLASGDIHLVVPAGTEDIVTFSYTVADPSGATSTAEAEILVLPENVAPVAIDDGPFDSAEATPVTIAEWELLANDFDDDGDTLTITAVANAVGGTAILNPDATVTFTPDAGFLGAASFEYTTEDPDAESATASVDITVHAINIINGTGNNDTITGTAGWDHIFGGDGGDDIDGAAGNDTIEGGNSNDVLQGGDGDDTLWGGNNGDDLYGDAGNDTLYGESGVDELYGGDGLDFLFGGKSGDFIYGEDGADLAFGGDGDDTIEGGEGDDELQGEAGYDLLKGDGGNDLITGGGGNDTIEGGEGNDQLRGDAGNDSLSGGAGSDVLSGGTGSDTLDGGLGDDILTGGDGADVFVVTQGNGHDIIIDFAAGTSGTDKLDVSAFALTDLSDLLSLATEIGDDTLLTFDDDTSVRLTGVAASELHSGDIYFV
ncbi:MAG: cadherin-like domain-containing protein [Alphaproteobacteria bacterium]|nr:cadherin-like domain-containing protein [Alphaproteobacteria bacterium]